MPSEESDSTKTNAKKGNQKITLEYVTKTDLPQQNEELNSLLALDYTIKEMKEKQNR